MERATKGHRSENCQVSAGNPEEAARLALAEGCQREQCLDWDGAIASYRHALEVDPQDPLVRYFSNNNLGYSLLQLGRFDEAEEYCEAAIQINPAQYNAHKNLGLALEGQGRWMDAALSLAEAARVCPENTRAWMHLQHLLSRKPNLPDQSSALSELVRNLEAIYRDIGQSFKPY